MLPAIEKETTIFQRHGCEKHGIVCILQNKIHVLVTTDKDEKNIYNTKVISSIHVL